MRSLSFAALWHCPGLQRQPATDVAWVPWRRSRTSSSARTSGTCCRTAAGACEPASPLEKAALQINVFHAQTGAKLRKFEGSIEEFAVGSAATGDGSLKWPIFKWAASGCAPQLLLPPTASHRNVRMAADLHAQHLARMPAVMA